MALLGAQLVITLVMVSIIQKLGPHYSFARWILCSTGLIRYLYPTDQELRSLAGVPKEKPKKGKHGDNGKIGETFHVPRNLNITLESTKVVPLDVIHLKFYTEFQWLLDFSIYAAIVYILTEVYNGFYPIKDEVNLSMLWCMLVLGFALYPFVFNPSIDITKDKKIERRPIYAAVKRLSVNHFQFADWLMSGNTPISALGMPNSQVLTAACIGKMKTINKMLVTLWAQYFKGEESVGERSTCIVTGFAYLLVAMMVLIIDENTLEIGLEKAYSSFNQSASIFLDNQGLSSSGPASKIVLKFFLALWCGLLGSLFTFPGLRMSRMHWDSLKYCKDRKLMQVLLNISFASPFLLVILWIKPVSRDYLTARIFTGMAAPIMTVQAFESMRLVAVVIAVLLRLALMPLYLQSYLNLAAHRLEDQKKEAGRITNVELQKKIAAVFYYLCVVTLQFIAPIIICLYFTLMYKTLGGYTWEGLFREVPIEECPADNPPKITPALFPEQDEKTVIQTAQEFHLALDSLKQVFTTDVFRGLLGFATWWSCFTWFATTSMGMVYQSYFANA